MNRNDNKTKKRKWSFAAHAFFSASAIMLILWGGDYARRSLRPAPADPMEGIEDARDKPGKKVAETQPVTTEPVQETAIAGADPLIGGDNDVPESCVKVSKDQSALHSGKLLRLDKAHGYTGYEGALADFSERNNSLTLRYGGLQIQPCVVDALNHMATAYETAANNGLLLVYSTTEALESDGSLYPDPLPDRATGYCVDLAVQNEDATISPIYQPDAWLMEHAYLYGFVASYPDRDMVETGIPEAPYHFRYVGRVHAGVMHNEGWTLSEYLDEIKAYSVNAPYLFRDGVDTYSLYYVPAGETASTEVPVPLNVGSEVSGNNIDGYIVLAEGLLK